MQGFNSLIFMSLSLVLLATGGLAVADEQPLQQTPAVASEPLALDHPARDSEVSPIETATIERPAMTEQDVRMMIEGEVQTSLGRRLAQSAPQS